MPPQQQASHPRMSMVNVDPDEQLIATVYRHPIGILLLYAQVLVGILSAAALVWLILPNFVDEDSADIYGWFVGIFAAVAIFMVLILLVATVLYRQSKLVCTSKAITQVVQDGLFNRKISQLTIQNIEDVTADRRGLLQTIFNFGTLNIETAGEQMNFHFHFCPDPDQYAKIILETRQRFLGARDYTLSHGQQAATGSQRTNQAPPPSPTPQWDGQPPTQQQSYQQPYQYPPTQQPYPQAPPQPNPTPTQVSTPETDYHEPV